jgi:hypothetical protein
MEELQGLLLKIITRIMRLLTRQGLLIEEQGMSYLAEPDPDNALTPLQAASCTYRIALKAARGTEGAEPANRTQPTGQFHTARLRQRARFQPTCRGSLRRRSTHAT